MAAFPRPTRSRAYASPAALPHPSQGSLPVGAASPFAGRASHPLDDKPNFMGSSHHPSLRTSLSWSHCSSYALAPPGNALLMLVVMLTFVASPPGRVLGADVSLRAKLPTWMV